MKLLLTLLLLSATAHADLTPYQHVQHDLDHFAAGVIVGELANALLIPDRHKHPILVPLFIIGASLAVGAMKEAYDVDSGGTWDWEQFSSTGAGGTLAACTILTVPW